MATILVGACGSSPARPPVPFKTIALIPVASPPTLYTENRLAPLPVLPMLIASSIANRGKSAEFSQRMEKPRSEMGVRFTKMLLDELRARGFAVRIYDDFDRSPDAHDDIDYAKLSTHDAVLNGNVHPSAGSTYTHTHAEGLTAFAASGADCSASNG